MAAKAVCQTYRLLNPTIRCCMN
ncbi:MAG: hypothetical protein JWQ69_1872, partial [Pseudomonas sp.]|nr:hypothetical protein [Pseudomonas sp.]